MRPLVIVRPEPGAGATAEAAAALGLETIRMPLFEIRALEWTVPDLGRFDAFLLTSANALRHGGDGLDRVKRLPAYCVGEVTAAAAQEQNLKVAATGNGGIDALLETIPPGLKLLHLCGANRHEPMGHVHEVTPVAVYEAVELPAPDEFDAVEGSVVALHSPRAAATFARLAGQAGVDRRKIALAAISQATASAAGIGWECVEIAAELNDSALLAIAARLCHNSG